uniref:Transcription factor CBF/NF-Y/archaeal histone domain-containing protein n=1 Tax=Romanomermis culicivorax TaxID=13658 RepID=A0A915JF41_ROMCU
MASFVISGRQWGSWRQLKLGESPRRLPIQLNISVAWNFSESPHLQNEANLNQTRRIHCIVIGFTAQIGYCIQHFMSDVSKRKRSNSIEPSINDDDFDASVLLGTFWQSQQERVDGLNTAYFRDLHSNPKLPLARIKKIMKLDDDVKTQMISGEVTVLFSKAIEMFVEELTLRAWVHTDENKRKTLQKSDIALAIASCDQFDFLIDIVPRDEFVRPMPPKTVRDRSTKTQAPTQVTQSASISNNVLMLLNNSIQLGSPAVTTTPTVPVPQQQLILQKIGGQQSISFLAAQEPSPTTAAATSSQRLQLSNGQVHQTATTAPAPSINQQTLRLVQGSNKEYHLVQQAPSQQPNIRIIRVRPSDLTSTTPSTIDPKK